MLYALKSVFPKRGWRGAPVGPAPMSDALNEGATSRTADCASSIPVCTKLSFQICTRFLVEALDAGESAFSFS